MALPQSDGPSALTPRPPKDGSEQRSAFPSQPSDAPVNGKAPITLLAGRIAEHQLDLFEPRRGAMYTFMIFHDCRKRSTAGPCPVPYHWSRKNLAGVSFKDRADAKAWIVDALLHGCKVWRCCHGRYNGMCGRSLEGVDGDYHRGFDEGSWSPEDGGRLECPQDEPLEFQRGFVAGRATQETCQ